MSIGGPNDASPVSVTVTVTGNVHLILPDGCNLTIYGGIQVKDGNSLTIYGQSNPTVTNGTVSNNSTTGRLTAVSPYDPAGSFQNGTTAIGHPINDSPNCDIIINGGYVKATVDYSKKESPYPSGINGQTVTINGGYVNATGGLNGAGIGGGNSGSGGTINISGGNVTAKGGDYGAGIGGGKSQDGGNITISGGTVNATGGLNGASIGRGYNGNSGTFETTASGKAIIKAKSITDQSNKSSWSGIIFERSTGGVYGDQTLSSAFTVESGKNLLIAEGATLTTQGKLTNNGNIYVDGTLSGSVSGYVYYRLSLTNCTASSGTSTYSGNTYAAQGDSITLTSTTPAGYKFDSWSVTPGSVTISNNSFTMPGSAVAVTANTTQMVKITQQPEGKSVTYGESVTLSVTAENPSSNTTEITYQWYKGNGRLSGETNATLTLSKPGAGTNYYYCEVTYGGRTIKSNTATVTVDEADSTVTKAPAAVGNLVYNGSAQELVTPGTATGGTMQYASSENGSYSDVIPTGTNAGSYTVWYKVAGDSNHNDSNLYYVTVAIDPKFVTVSGITANGKTYDGTTDATLNCDNAAFGGKVDGDTLSVTATGAFADQNAGTDKTVNITNMALGGSSAGNYTLSESGQQTTATANITPKLITPTIVVTGTYTYTGDPITPDFTVKDDTTELTEGDYTAVVSDNIAAGTGTITVTAKDTGNYTFSEKEQTFPIGKASQSATVTLNDWTYGDTANEPEVTGNEENGTVTYRYKVKGASGYLSEKPTDAGSYTVEATLAPTDNYQQAVATADSPSPPRP